MGASQSSSQDDGGGGRRGTGRPMTSDGIDTQDYYGLLELPDPSTTTSTSEEIRKSYRRLALRHHPDKNKDNVEAANERFRLIQAAYEVLSDEQERAWYDGHREQILQGYDGDDDDDIDAAFDEEAFQSFRTGKQKPPPAPTGSSSPGLTPRHILRFLDVSLCMDTTPPSADESGFFGTYRRIFERLAEEEKGAAAYPGESQTSYEVLPGFGYSHTPYLHAKTSSSADDATVHQTQVRDFYTAWGAFGTRKGFAWRDGHRLNEAPDRRVKRAMEKANKTMRDASRREYNDTVRSLVNFVRKRDPRVKAHLAAVAAQQASMSAAAASREGIEQRKRAIEQEMRAQEERARAAYKKQSWDAWEQDVGVGNGDTSEDEDSEASFGKDVRGQGVQRDGNDDDDDEQDGGSDDGEDEAYGDDAALECFACDKVFQSEAAFANHERSNKHKKQVQKLRREMLKEDRSLRESMAAMDVKHDKNSDEADVRNDLKVKLPNNKEDGEGEEEDDVATAGMSKKARQRLKKRLKEQEKAAAASATTSTTGTAQASSDEEGEEPPSVEANTVQPETSSPSEQQQQQQQNEAPTKKSRRANKNGGGGGGKMKERCNVCSTGFASRSKLFSHIRETGHALAGTQPSSSSSSGKRA